MEETRDTNILYTDIIII